MLHSREGEGRKDKKNHPDLLEEKELTHQLLPTVCLLLHSKWLPEAELLPRSEARGGHVNLLAWLQLWGLWRPAWPALNAETLSHLQLMRDKGACD